MKYSIIPYVNMKKTHTSLGLWTFGQNFRSPMMTWKKKQKHVKITNIFMFLQILISLK